MFLQPKTDFGLFTCISSSLLTIFIGFVQCQPRDFLDTISFGGFFIILGLYYYYCRITYAPSNDEVHFRVYPFQNGCTSFKLRLLGNNIWDESQKRVLSSNELYHIQYNKNSGHSKIYNLIPSCFIDSDTRSYLLQQNPYENRYLNQYYVLEAIIEHAQVEPITCGEMMGRAPRSVEEYFQSATSRFPLSLSRSPLSLPRSPLQSSASEVATSRSWSPLQSSVSEVGTSGSRIMGSQQRTQVSIDLV